MQEEKKTTAGKPADSAHYVPDADGSRRRRRHVWRILIICAAIIAAIVLAVGLPYVADGADKEQLVRIPHGADGKQLRDSLNTYFSPTYTNKVMTLMKLSDSDKVGRSGAFLITKGMSPLRAARLLGHGAQHPVKLTINGFRHVDELTRRVAMKLETDTTALRKALFDKEMLRKYDLDSLQSIALFIEATYEVYWDASPEEVIATFARNYAKVWNDKRRAKAKELGVTPSEMMTICSMVDEETLNKSEKGPIGRIYLNRLKKGMRLQSCPSARYAVGDFSIRRLTNEHTQFESPYNTYLHDGLPPGPIRTSSVATIDTILNSAPNDYLYMCAKEDFSGTHNFASDYETHMANARRYQNELNKKGIK